MAIKRLKPKNDFIFQRLFGEQEAEDSLISLLNAILRLEEKRRIVHLTVIENKQLAKKLIDDKTGRLDVRAETADQVQINIEVQLTDYRNMPRRSLFYLSKLYADSIKSGGRYEELKKTIAINIVDFRLFDIERFHSTFHFYEDNEHRFMLTDAMEVHFIEYPKFKAARKNLDDPLHRWLLFLDEKLPEDQLKELVEMDPVIGKAEERLEWLSSDEETIRLYEAREYSLIERNSLVADGEARGMEKGMALGRAEGKVEGKAEGKAEGVIEAKAEVAMTMIRKGADDALIMEFTGMSLEEITTLRNQLTAE
jgi:predicted transposase/invertase (TIGR01784 family)